MPFLDSGGSARVAHRELAGASWPSSYHAAAAIRSLDRAGERFRINPTQRQGSRFAQSRLSPVG
ncbi:MAG: hypothetical protein ACE5GW_09440, partial [Planctomycetota bacterium]